MSMECAGVDADVLVRREAGAGSVVECNRVTMMTKDQDGI